MIKVFAAMIGIGLLAGCKSTPEDLTTLPDSYFQDRPLYALSSAERGEFWRRFYERERERDRQAACVFGTKAIIDRTKLNCENVKGSPEYKSLHGLN